MSDTASNRPVIRFACCLTTCLLIFVAATRSWARESLRAEPERTKRPASLKLPFGSSASENSTTGTHLDALSDIIGKPILRANVRGVLDRAGRLSEESRPGFLLNWVLPGPGHSDIRLAGAFTPPAPSHKGGKHIAQDQSESRNQVSGHLVAPAIELVDLASESSELDYLKERVSEIEISDAASHQQRCRTAMLYLIEVARNDADAARSHLALLFRMFTNSGRAGLSGQWPEMLALSRAVEFAPTREIAGEFFHRLVDLYNNDERDWVTFVSSDMDRYFFFLWGKFRSSETRDTGRHHFPKPPSLRNWTSVSYATAQTQGNGYPGSHWQWGDRLADKLAGHECDHLMYRIPLRGNYEVECDVSLFNWRETQLMVAGISAAPHWNRKKYEIRTFRGFKESRELNPPLAETDAFAHVRVVMQDGNCTTYYNGRPIHKESQTDHAPPWISVCSLWRFQGTVRDIRISGNPTVPEQVDLSTQPDLAGWISYFGETIGSDGDWQHHGPGEITSKLKPELAGTFQEALLQYQRPMLEDGTIEYEFYYEPGRVEVHPALGRIAFVLQPDGVRIHQITNGPYDRTDADPAVLLTETDSHNERQQLPFRNSQWNRLRLSVSGSTVRLKLNEQLICERNLDAANGRTFGLFHYAGATGTRIKNIVWRGEWPTSLPSVSDQQLAQNTQFPDKSAGQLKAVFSHDFATDGLPTEKFLLRGDDVENHISVQPHGIQVVRPSDDDWKRAIIYPRIRIGGDFDVTVAFDQLKTSAVRQDSPIPLAASMDLFCALSGPAEEHYKIIQREEKGHRRLLVSHFAATRKNRARRDIVGRRPYEAESGRLRLARRGDRIYFLFAEGDSSSFRLLTTEDCSAQDTDINGIRLGVEARGTGNVSIVWKNLIVCAQRIMNLPAP